MNEQKLIRLKQVATTLNISTSTVVDFLSGKGFDIENKPTSKITSEQFNMLMKAFESSVQAKIEAAELNLRNELLRDNNPSKIKKEIGCAKFNIGSLDSSLLSNLIFPIDEPRLNYFDWESERKYKLRRVASFLKTEVSTLTEILRNNGYYLNNSSSKITQEELKVLSSYFAVQIDIAIADCDLTNFSCDTFGTSSHSELRFIFLEFKTKEHFKKLGFIDLKFRLNNILTPKLFHVFSSDEDNRVAKPRRASLMYS